MDFQVVIHIGHKPLKFASKWELANYVDHHRKVAKNWAKFDDLPLLKVVDDKTNEVFEFPKNLPAETLVNSGGRNLLIIGNG